MAFSTLACRRLFGFCLLLLLESETSAFCVTPLRGRGLLKAPLSYSQKKSRRFLCTTPSFSPVPSKNPDGEEASSEQEGEVTIMSANPLYGVGRIQRARASPDDKRLSKEENEQRRAKTIQEWESALAATNLNWGGRQAIADAPVWATPHVMHGGFVSGKLLAQLQDDDVANDYYLTAPGLMELDSLLKNGCYRIRVPEHGALLMVAWLLGNEKVQEAEAILKEITPHFHRLRFYPDKADTPLVELTASSLFVSSVGDAKQAIEHLIRIQTTIHIPRIRKKIAQRKALQDWLPLKQNLLSLWAETCKDGTPAVYFSQDWQDRATLLVEEFNELAIRDKETNSGRIRMGSTKDMVTCMETCLANGTKHLSHKERDNLETILSGSAKKYGIPGSVRFLDTFRELQNSTPTDETPQMKKLINRLAQEDAELGLSQQLIDKITEDLPEKLQLHVRRTLMGSIEELVEAGLISSSDALAVLIPTITSQSANANVPDLSLRRLGFALDSAFSKRRSLILFNLQSQVGFHELPWAQPLLQRRQGESESASATLKLIVETVLETFPQTILPNKLLQSMRTLVYEAQIDLPLTDELAADIFMGSFSSKFHRSAHLAADLLEGSLYERYFGLDYAQMREQDAPLAFLGEHGGFGSVMKNFHVIEQQQIITTHNLAACYLALGLELNWCQLALKVWDWILSQLSGPYDSTNWHANKKIGSAWRQLLFFVSVADDKDGLLEMMRERCASKFGQKRRALELVFLSQLEKAMNGEKPDAVMLGIPPFRHPLLSLATPYEWVTLSRKGLD